MGRISTTVSYLLPTPIFKVGWLRRLWLTLFQAPAREALSFERQRFNITDVTLFPLKYLGKPSDAIEEAWEELLERKCLSILFSTFVFLNRCCIFNDGV